VRDAVTVAVEKDEIENGADLLAVSQDKWMAVYRCRTCGTLWAEACYSSGHMDLFYLFPVPPTDDPVRWLHEEAAELPSGHDYLRPSS
jgi:hypothetical protein